MNICATLSGKIVLRKTKTTNEEEHKCSSNIIIPERKLCGYEKANKIFERSEKFLAGCSAIGGKPVKEISKEIGMSREYVYQQKEQVSRYAESLDKTEPEAPVIRLDKRTKITIEQAVESYKKIYSENFLASNFPDMLKVSNAYVIRDGVVTAAWVFSEEHDLLNMVMIDATTGERISMH